jgi:hypothetical protein
MTAPEILMLPWRHHQLVPPAKHNNRLQSDPSTAGHLS